MRSPQEFRFDGMYSDVTYVVDYGMGNLLSVRRALEHVGATVCVTTEPTDLVAADRIVLPGVGAFPTAMEELNRRGFSSKIRELGRKGVPVLGICLGMQLLFDSGLEYQATRGLELIPGSVEPISNSIKGDVLFKVPHVGWSPISQRRENCWVGTILRGIQEYDPVYFVHSYMVCPKSDKYIVADCKYGDIKIPAVVENGNVIGCQFHPEKSGDTGLRILEQFSRL